MRILLIMDPGIPVPPKFYGGHERLVYIFAEEYQRMGHDVTLLAGPDSNCSGKTVTFGVNSLQRSPYQKLTELFFVWNFLNKNNGQFDLIHNFGRLLYLFTVLNSKVNKIMTYGRKVTPLGIRAVNSRPNKNLIFTACSNNCAGTGNVAGKWVTVYNTIDFGRYQLAEKVADDAPLIFLGRLDRIKGVHTAIEAALATGNQLILAGNISHTPDNYQYFKTQIEPYIDNVQIKYVGALNDDEKNFYLGRAKALLFPIEWDEPFGLVMIEAMACGTPVIAFRRGSVPEVIIEGVTGYVVSNTEEMNEKVYSIKKIDRTKCREVAEHGFNSNKIASHYLSLFDNLSTERSHD